MQITVNPELKAYIDPLTPDEHAALERSILAEGCRDALVLWGDVLVDGHNRYGICRKHGLPFQTAQNSRFKSIEDVQMIVQIALRQTDMDAVGHQLGGLETVESFRQFRDLDSSLTDLLGQ